MKIGLQINISRPKMFWTEILHRQREIIQKSLTLDYSKFGDWTPDELLLTVLCWCNTFLIKR